MSDYWDDYSEYDAIAAEMKDALRVSVKDEIKKRIEMLATENKELKTKLKDLDQLEREAIQSKAKYDREFANAKRDAAQAARKEKLASLLTALDERLYTVEHKSTKREKCDQCDDTRRIYYLTPKGKKAYESCECDATDWRWEAEEIAAHEVSSRDGGFTIWWAAVSKWNDADALNPRVLKRAEGVPIEKLASSPTGYSYKDRASAQYIADVANREVDE